MPSTPWGSLYSHGGQADLGIAPQKGPKGSCSAVCTINTRRTSAGSSINDVNLSGGEPLNMICVGSNL
jgi:hypothetical protein